MDSSNSRRCPQCGEPVAADAERCPHCRADLSIVTMSVEPIPPDTGAPEAEEEAASADLAEASPGELLPPEIDLPEGSAWSGSYSVKTSITTVSSSKGGSGGKMDAEVSLHLPQEVVDPEQRLTPGQYSKLMTDWGNAIEREVEQAAEAGQKLSFADAARRVPLPFDATLGADLTVAQRDVMTRRAQEQAAQMLDIPRGFPVLPGGAPMLDLLPAGQRPVEFVSRPRKRGITISCGGLLYVVLLIAAGAAVILLRL